MVFMRQCVVNVTEIRQFWWDFVKAALFLKIIKSPFWLYPSFWWFKVCMECAEKYCASCFKSFHQKGALKKHTTQSVDQVSVIIWIIIYMQKFNPGWLAESMSINPKQCRVGLVVRALAFHQCGPSSISALGVTCGLSLLVLYSAMRGFSLSSKTNIWFEFIWFVKNNCK